MDARQHWQEVYSSRTEDTVSWFQHSPDLSLSLIAATNLAFSDPIIDVGGGASRLVDRLVIAGYRDISVLDIASAAMQRSRARLGPAAERVRWLAADITRWQPTRGHALWHDRAVFHFLTEPEQRLAYRRALEAGLRPGGTAIIASFAPDGPERCSGLPVRRYSPGSLSEEFGSAFRLTDSRTEEHLTPAGKLQRFQYSVFRFSPASK
jgi:trans-aconitate methyltransferase